MFLFSKRIYMFLCNFLIISQFLNTTYELVDQNKEWDSDDKNSSLFQGYIIWAELTITVSLEKLKIKDDSGKNTMGASNSIPSDWKVKYELNSHGNLLMNKVMRL